MGSGAIIGAGAKLLGPIKVGARARVGANSVVIHDVPADATVVGNPGHPVRVNGRKPKGPDADWAHLPDPVADAMRGMANRLNGLEEIVAELTGRKPEGAEVSRCARAAGPTPPGASASVVHGPRAVARHGLVVRGLPAVPEPSVEHARRNAGAAGDELARVQRAGADLGLLVARRDQLPGVDAGGQLGVVAQHPVHAQHVGHEVVGEDREPVQVGNSATPASARSEGTICARL